LGNGKYNKDMIDEDYRRQKGLIAQLETQPEPQPEPAPAPEVHTESGLDKFTAEAIKDAASNQTKPSAACSGDTCEKCGKKLIGTEALTSQKFCDGHLFCEEHRLAYIQERMDAKKRGSR
ncbi:MAG TPA: hypothetical protein O0X27_06135, partial [Methanocorpusculum sp.]|nr:hypothetical protein [Methanocorpusculum sp.]